MEIVNSIQPTKLKKLFEGSSPTKSKALIITNIISLVICTTITIIFSTYYDYNIPFLLIVFGTFSIITYSLIVFHCISYVKKLKIATEEIKQERFHNKSLQISNDSIRAFKHDFHNIIQSIGGYVYTNDINGLKDYYSELMSDCQNVNNINVLSSDMIDNPAIYNLISEKYFEADNLGIKTSLNIFMHFSELNIKTYEFTRILGILLDNAIEAATNSIAKNITIECKKDTANNRYLVIIKNSYSNKNINLDKIFEKGVTTKPNNSGLGLWEVNQILNKIPNINLYTYKDFSYFTQQIEIYQK